MDVHLCLWLEIAALTFKFGRAIRVFKGYFSCEFLLWKYSVTTEDGKSCVQSSVLVRLWSGSKRSSAVNTLPTVYKLFIWPTAGEHSCALQGIHSASLQTLQAPFPPAAPLQNVMKTLHIEEKIIPWGKKMVKQSL